MKPYKEGTTAIQIMRDGWSRGFSVTQTVKELTESGYDIPTEEVLRFWSVWEAEFQLWCEGFK